MPDFPDMKAGYLNLWNQAEVTREDICRKVAREIIADRDRYKAIEVETGVPWFWIAITHHRESNRNFLAVLHNGQRIVGTGRKTTIYPQGKGPFATFEEAAIDALQSHNLHKIKDWSLERMLYEFERWNGWGYFGRINSPYVWAATSAQQRGKYVADGKFSYSTWDKQIGCAALLKTLAELDLSVANRLGAPQPDDPDIDEDAGARKQPVSKYEKSFWTMLFALGAALVAGLLKALGVW